MFNKPIFFGVNNNRNNKKVIENKVEKIDRFCINTKRFSQK
jgi:hypothetical protein